MLASEYGWTLDEISAITPRQAQLLTSAMSVRKHNVYVREVKLQASVHGAKTEVKEKKYKRSSNGNAKNHTNQEIEIMRKATIAGLQRNIDRKLQGSKIEQHNNQHRRKNK